MLEVAKGILAKRYGSCSAASAAGIFSPVPSKETTKQFFAPIKASGIFVFLRGLRKAAYGISGRRAEEKRVEKQKREYFWLLTNSPRLLCLVGWMDATLLDREADCSLTTDTMCQNLFEPI